jgi:predicted nucleotidyltransferase
LKTSPLDLRPGHQQVVLAILRDHIPGRVVRAFGSRVAGSAKPMSDLDLCIMGEKPLPAKQLAALVAAFSDSTLPIKVDVVEWATISPAFRAIIEEWHAVL